jgi:hypothetical protein
MYWYRSQVKWDYKKKCDNWKSVTKFPSLRTGPNSICAVIILGSRFQATVANSHLSRNSLRSRPLVTSSSTIYGSHLVLRDLTVMAYSRGRLTRVVGFRHANKQYRGQVLRNNAPTPFTKGPQEHSRSPNCKARLVGGSMVTRRSFLSTAICRDMNLWRTRGEHSIAKWVISDFC